MISDAHSDSVDDRTRQAWARHLGCDPDAVDPEGMRSDLTATSVPDALTTAAKVAPNGVLTVGAESTTYAQLAADVDRSAAVLAKYALAAGERVAINAGSSLDLVRAYLAVLRAGLVAVLVNPSYTGGELAALLERSDARLLLHEGEPESSPTTTATLGLAELIERAGRTKPLTAPGPSSCDVALLAFTSGTTGAPKGVPLTHAHLLSSVKSAMLAWRWHPTDVLVHCLPLFHQHGLSGVHASLLAGSGAHLLAQYDGEELLDTIERSGATIMFGVPAIHRRLLDLGPERLQPLRQLRFVTSGSGPLPPSLAEAFEAATGQQLLERYGLTETGLDLSNPYDGPRIAGTVGFPLPGVEIRLTDADGTEVPDGGEGEICLRGPQVFDGYLQDPTATSGAFWEGGWFRTGDVGRRDADGRYAITGRLKELVITGGMNVSPLEVEVVVEELDWVHEAAVAGLPSEEWGEEVAVWVVTRPGAEAQPAELLAYCHERLAGYKRPKQVFVVSELPRNATGKVVRSQLVAGGADQ